MHRKTSKLLHSQKGETLIEAITSIMLFSMLMLLMATIISFSVKLNANTNVAANVLQAEVNVINENLIPTTKTSTVKFVPQNGIASKTQKIAVTDNTASNSLLAFRPID